MNVVSTSSDASLESVSSCASSLSSPPPHVPHICRDTCVLPRQEPLVVLGKPSLERQNFGESIWSHLEEPKTNAKLTVAKMNHVTRTLDSVIASLESLNLYLNGEAREQETTSMPLRPSSPVAAQCMSSPRITPIRLFDTIEALQPCNPRFMHAPVYESPEVRSQILTSGGSGDPLAPERLMLRLKRSQTSPIISSPPVTSGSMDIKEKTL